MDLSKRWGFDVAHIQLEEAQARIAELEAEVAARNIVIADYQRCAGDDAKAREDYILKG